MNHQKHMTKILIENDAAVKAVTNLIKNDKEADKIYKNNELVDYLDFIYNRYDKDLEKIMKKYKLDYDELAKMLLK